MRLEICCCNMYRYLQKGQFKSECLTCTFRASRCSARLSRALVPDFAGSSVRDWVCRKRTVILKLMATFYRIRLRRDQQAKIVRAYEFRDIRLDANDTEFIRTHLVLFTVYSSLLKQTYPPWASAEKIEYLKT